MQNQNFSKEDEYDNPQLNYPPPSNGFVPQPGYPTETGYTSQPGYPQQNITTVQYNAANQNVMMRPAPIVNFTGAIVLSCVVVWCCGCLCGLIAFILAMVGSNDRNQSNARQLMIASYVFSSIGICVGIIIIVAVVVTSLTVTTNIKNCTIIRNGVTYKCGEYPSTNLNPYPNF